MRHVSAGGVILLLTAASLACSHSPVDPIERLRGDLVAAAEARDAERFESLLSEEFRGDRGLTRAEALVSLRRYFGAYESVDVEVYGLEIDRADTTAEVRCVVEFAGRPRSLAGLPPLLPPEAAYRFRLSVADEGEVWRVRSAAWEPVGLGGGS